MKKRILKRFLSAALAVVMVFLMMPIGAIRVSAAGSTKKMTPLEQYRANTTKSLKHITEYISKREAADKALQNSFGNKIKKINTVSAGIGTAVNTALMVYNTIDEDASWQENLWNVGMNLISSYLGVSLPGQNSEADVIIKEIEKMMDEVNQRIDAVNENINALSEQVDQNISSLASLMTTISQLEADADILNEFTQISSKEAYSYYRDRDALYEKYEDLNSMLNATIPSNDSDIKYAYDALYREAIKSEQLYEYITREAGESPASISVSILEALYEYSVLSEYLFSENQVKDEHENVKQDENGDLNNIEMKCVEFAEDLYSTYMFSNYALMLCYNYQIEYANSHNTKYYELSDAEEPIFIPRIFKYSSITTDRGHVQKMIDNQEEVQEKIASYMAYVLNLGGSYLYENGATYENGTKVNENTVYSIPYQELFGTESPSTEPYTIKYGDCPATTKYVRTNNKVSHGDTLYMNVLPNDLASLFASGDFTFGIKQFVLDDSMKEIELSATSTVSNAGVVNVLGNAGEKIRVTMYYNGVECYSMDFDIIERPFSGGMGIADCPYFVSKWEDITALAGSVDHYQDENIHFEMTRDIDGYGAVFKGIPSFKGTWNGNGYRVYHFEIDMSGIYDIGFFRVIEYDATVKNFTIGHYGESYLSYDNYSVYINGYLNCDGVLYVGGLCGVNCGVISNCSLEAVKVCGKIYWAGDNDISNAVGGIAGRNDASIDNCKVSKSFFYSNASAKKDGDASLCKAYTGGIVGKNVGYLKDSVSYNNHMGGYTYSKQNWGDAPGAYTYCGAMMGWLTHSATAENCYEMQNTFDTVADADDSDNDGTVEDGICGYRDFKLLPWEELGIITNCGENSLGPWSIDSTTGCPKKFSLIKHPDDILGGGTYANVLEYVRGERYLKYTYTTAGDPMTATTTTHEYELSEGRIDTSEVGTWPAIKLIAVDGTTQYKKEVLNVTVVPEEITELVVYTEPIKKTYAVNSEFLDLAGLRLAVVYNNHSTRFLNDGSKEGATKEFTETYDFTAVGETSITFSYGDFSQSVPVTVVHCAHGNTESRTRIEPTCGTVGYEVGTYCTDCQGYIEGGTQIPMTNRHSYSEWTEYDQNRHWHECSCGKIEYEYHSWNDGEITTPATFEQTGIKTYTCRTCSGTYTAVIPMLENPTRFIVDHVGTMPGKTVEVNIRLENNPGVAMMRLQVAYDPALLTLDQVTYNSAIGGTSTQPAIFEDSAVLLWYNNSENVEGDWIFATLSFTVKETADVGSTSDIVLTYDADEVCDIEENKVLFAIDNGSASALDHVPGDINGDQSLTAKDLLRLAKHFTGWEDEVNELALDVNGDGKVNSQDLLRLSKYLAGWNVRLY